MRTKSAKVSQITVAKSDVSEVQSIFISVWTQRYDDCITTSPFPRSLSLEGCIQTIHLVYSVVVDSFITRTLCKEFIFIFDPVSLWVLPWPGLWPPCSSFSALAALTLYRSQEPANSSPVLNCGWSSHTLGPPFP